MPKPKKDCSADFHRAMREKREKEQQKTDIKPVPKKIGEGRDNLKKRGEHFRKRRGS